MLKMPLQPRGRAAVFAWIALWSCSRALGGDAKPLLILNEDDSHFFGTRSAEQVNIEGLRAFVDQYANTAVTHLFLCPNAMKASHRSQARDAIWDFKDGQKPPDNEFAEKWCENARLLDERGLDPYTTWIARCREKKISPWLSMRMNDVHNADDVDNYIHSSFWGKHPEYWRVPGGRGWTDRALDYGVREVREHAMAYVRELLERYDPDGLELDWMRFGYHFRPGKEAEGAALLTQFMRDVRGLTHEWSKRRGHPIKLGARVPTLPHAARGLLPLAWLVRVDDTPEHRQWLRPVATDLVALQDASGAIREVIAEGTQGTLSNTEYDTRESSLIQTNGDPICDLLYTCNFALIGLPEAAAATEEPFYARAEDRLAGFLCRVQISSQAHPDLDGAWYRGFDFRRWEYWASNADWEWGPWCTETGWTQPWIAGTLACGSRRPRSGSCCCGPGSRPTSSACAPRCCRTGSWPARHRKSARRRSTSGS